MDLVEISQSTNLFGIPICVVDHFDTLDCPTCSYSTNAESYDYLLACKLKPIPIADGPFDGNGLCFCQGCNASPLSQQWQYCPNCGEPNLEASRTEGRQMVPHVGVRTRENDSEEKKEER
jgi:hypothetical protein